MASNKMWALFSDTLYIHFTFHISKTNQTDREYQAGVWSVTVFQQCYTRLGCDAGHQTVTALCNKESNYFLWGVSVGFNSMIKR